MNQRRRTVAILAVVAALMLIAAPLAHAAAGGGSAGFGGGGGGGGRGAGLYILIQILIRIAIFGHGLGALVLIGIVLLVVAYAMLAPKVAGFWSATQSQGRASRRRTAERERRVELAAAEAADEDAAFDPDVVKPAAKELFTEIQAAWDAGDRTALAGLVAPDLMAEWNRRLDDFARRGWRNRTQPIGEPKIDYVGLTNRGDERQDRAVVRIEARLRDFVEDSGGNRIKRAGRLSETIRIREFWTLKRRNGRWVLASIEQGAEGTHALADRITPTAWSDEQALRDQAMLEQASANALPAGVKPADVAELQFSGDARAAALDLSLADDRFSPDVLEIAARRTVQAWADAVDGDDGPLLEIADASVVRTLLHPAGPSSRLVVRGPRIRQIRIAGLDAAAEPATMTLDVELSGRRYLEDRATTAVLQGNSTRESSFTEHWTLALDGDRQQPWRLVAAGATAASA